MQLALNVADLEASVAFYSKLFGAEPAKRRPGYANFALAEPPLKLVLIEGEPGQEARLDHLGVEVESTAQVDVAADRLTRTGVAWIDGSTMDCDVIVWCTGFHPVWITSTLWVSSANRAGSLWREPGW